MFEGRLLAQGIIKYLEEHCIPQIIVDKKSDEIFPVRVARAMIATGRGMRLTFELDT